MNGKQRLKTGLHRSFWSYLAGICIDMWLRWVLLVTWILLTWSSGKCTFSVWNWHKRLFFFFISFLCTPSVYFPIPGTFTSKYSQLNVPWAWYAYILSFRLGEDRRFRGLVDTISQVGRGLTIYNLHQLPGHVPWRAAGVNNELAWTRAFVSLMALHRAEDHVIILRHLSLDWISSFCLFVF